MHDAYATSLPATCHLVMTSTHVVRNKQLSVCGQCKANNPPPSMYRTNIPFLEECTYALLRCTKRTCTTWRERAEHATHPRNPSSILANPRILHQGLQLHQWHSGYTNSKLYNLEGMRFYQNDDVVNDNIDTCSLYRFYVQRLKWGRSDLLAMATSRLVRAPFFPNIFHTTYYVAIFLRVYYRWNVQKCL